MTKIAGPDCAVNCNLINTHTHTYIHTLFLLSYGFVRTEGKHEIPVFGFGASPNMPPYGSAFLCRVWVASRLKNNVCDSCSVIELRQKPLPKDLDHTLILGKTLC